MQDAKLSYCAAQRPALVAHKVKWDLENLVYRLSTSVLDLSEFGKTKKYCEGLLGKTACVYAEDITLQAGKLVDFGDVRSPIVGYIERFSTRKLVHYRLVALESSNRILVYDSHWKA